MANKQKYTMYVRGRFGYSKTEVTDIEADVVSYAQYKAAVRVTFLPKGARKRRSLTETYKPSIVVLEGWGHPDPGSPFGEEESVGGVVTMTTRYTSFDERYSEEFNTMIDAYIAKTGTVVVEDFRKHDSMNG